MKALYYLAFNSLITLIVLINQCQSYYNNFHERKSYSNLEPFYNADSISNDHGRIEKSALLRKLIAAVDDRENEDISDVQRETRSYQMPCFNHEHCGAGHYCPNGHCVSVPCNGRRRRDDDFSSEINEEEEGRSRDQRSCRQIKENREGTCLIHSHCTCNRFCNCDNHCQYVPYRKH